jgi:LysM repeat protein
VATASPSPTPVPEPTAQTYTIKSGDTLSRIARDHGLTLDQLLQANKDTISNPNRIAAGDVIIIPVPPTDEVDGGEASPSP